MAEGNAADVIPSGMVARQDFGGRELARSAETNATAVAARARALVEARYTMALQRPRDMDEVRLRLLKECKRPGFAEVARYRKPLGGNKYAEDFSIRFMEAAARCMTNVDIQVAPVFEDQQRRLIEVLVIDLESNLSESVTFTVEKTVERRTLKDGQEAISVRTNSRGEQTYLVAATEDDMLGKTNARISKAKRNAVKHLIPGDLLDECKAQIEDTQKARDAADPDAARKKLADAFAAMGVMPGDLKAYLGHGLETCSPPEMKELRGIYQAIRDGETTWREVLDAARGGPEEKTKPVSEKIKDKAAKVKPAETPPPASAAAPVPGEEEPPPPSDAPNDINF